MSAPAALLKWPMVGALALAALWFVFRIYSAGQPLWALGVLVLCAAGFVVYATNVAFAYRYLFPGLAGIALFVALPLAYTVQIGFTNFSSSNLLSLDRATTFLTEQRLADERRALGFTLHAEGSTLRLVLTPLEDAEAAQSTQRFISPPLSLPTLPDGPVAMTPLTDGTSVAALLQPAMSLKATLAWRSALQELVLLLPDGQRRARRCGLRMATAR